MMYAGIDIGGTNIKYGVVNTVGEILYHNSHPTSALRGKDAMIQDIQSAIQNLQQEYPSIQSIGVGFPSVVNPQDGCVYYPPNLPGWGIVPLVQLLQDISAIPVAVDNDANVAALAESEFGAGKNTSHFLYITLGTGVGGGIIINGRIFTGERGGAGEIGHTIVDINDEPTTEMRQLGRLFRAGTLEEKLGRAGLISLTQSFMAKYPESVLHSYNPLDVEHISIAVERGDTCAIECFTYAGRILGLGIAGVLALLDMRVIVVGGGISNAHPLFLDTALATLQERALPTIAPSVEIRKAHFSNHAGIVGSAILGKQKLESYR
jgi:glucokinase